MADEKTQEDENKEISEAEKRIRQIALSYYSRQDVQDAIFNFSKDREVVPRYFEGFGKRPDSLQYKSDILEMVKKGATSFHSSEELWHDPLQISTEMEENAIKSLRKGWDLLIDIDSKYLDYSKIAAELIVEALGFHNVKNVGVKFSGNKGFHILVPWNAFPEEINNVKTSSMFPEWPRMITRYLSELIKKQLIERVSEMTTGKTSKYIKGSEEVGDALKQVMPDIILVSPRHLFRMPYSVDFDEPICIEKDNKIEIIEIGSFVDKFFDKKENLQIADLSGLNYKTLSLNIGENRTRLSKIKKVIRHEIDKDLFLIKLESGRKVRVTSGHSLFILREGKIKIIKGDQIKKGDYITGLRKINLSENKVNNICLSEELIKILKNEEKRNVFLYGFDKSIFDKIYKINLPERKKQEVYNWKVYNILPLDSYEFLLKNGSINRNSFKKSKIKFCLHGGGTLGVFNHFKIDKDLMRLLGYYISEGHSDINRNRISFSFGSHEKDLINDCINILKRLQLRPRIEKPHKTVGVVTLNSPILKLIFTRLFKCGKKALEKRVPSIIWNLNRKLKIDFLKAYIKGDGHLEKKWSKIIISTGSRKLKEDLCFLLTSLGVGYSLAERRITRYNKGKNLSYTVIVQGKEDVKKLGFDSFSKIKKNSLTNRFPIKEIGLEQFVLKSRWKRQYLKDKVIRRGYNFIKKLNPPLEILKLISGDTAFLRVVEIRKIKAKHKYVYDLSVENDENFIGGTCILLHNSLHEKTSLASVVIHKDKIKDFTPREANPLKIKPINFLPEPEENEARELLIQALDWYKEKAGEKPQKQGKREEYKEFIIRDIRDEMFPPCIKKILEGMKDGRKRALFILINFFRSLNLEQSETEKRVDDWNKKNPKPLPQNYVSSQLSWHFRQKKILPPNCDKDYYNAISVCQPDEFCSKIKNPVNYTIKKYATRIKQKRH